MENETAEEAKPLARVLELVRSVPNKEEEGTRQVFARWGKVPTQHYNSDRIPCMQPAFKPHSSAGAEGIEKDWSGSLTTRLRHGMPCLIWEPFLRRKRFEVVAS